MEENVFPPGNTISVPPMLSAMDVDFMDELLLDGCWLETTDGSEFLHTSLSTSIGSFDASSFTWSPSLETGIWPSSLPQICYQDIAERSDLEEVYGRDLVSPNRRWWIGPRANPAVPGTSVMERLVQALRYIKDDVIKDRGSLIQLWVPVNRSGKRVLTTNEQPFTLDSMCQRLARYREISVNYQFSTEEEDSKNLTGLPGRVFLGKVPEWTPDVRFFRSEEYPRVRHAQNFDVRGTLAIPVFEQGSKICLGVIEVVMTTQIVKSRPELESICKALEAVNLKGTEVPILPQVRDLSYQAALPEIRNLLRCACETHKLPLAQTWVSCLQQGKCGCRHTHENYIHCVSTVDDACYVGDPSVREFHEACSEHHILKGQGVAGKAFLTNEPCFSPDITNCKKTEYPLSHHATMFGLHGAVAIRLRCVHTGTADFVLEFFLPKNCRDLEEQRKMLNSLSTIMAHVPVSLRTVTEKELEEETESVTSEVIEREETLSKMENKSEVHHHLQQNSSWTASLTEVQRRNNPQKIGLVFDGGASEIDKQKDVFDMKRGFEYDGDSSMNESAYSSAGFSGVGEKRRTKAEKNITLDVLRQYFAGSLKDAAKSIGVCPTTLKRICRQHGIQRWPSRKIKKVGHSLQKIQRVIDSVQGVSGPLPFGSFYTSFPELASPKQSQSKTLPPSNPADNYPKPLVLQPESCVKSPSSSCSQSSSSSQCCSSETQPNTSSVFHKQGVVEEPSVGDNSLVHGSILKKTRSETELLGSSLEETKILPRSHSQKSLAEKDPVSENLPQFPEMHIQEDDFLRIKVTYQDEKIRFRMQNYCRFKDLLWEISKRFNIVDVNEFDLKYLDDDNEWVLLTCDADLEECIDVSRSSPTQTIRLLLQASSHQLPERSSASRCHS